MFLIATVYITQITHTIIFAVNQRRHNQANSIGFDESISEGQRFIHAHGDSALRSQNGALQPEGEVIGQEYGRRKLLHVSRRQRQWILQKPKK